MMVIKGVALQSGTPVDLRDDGVPMVFRHGTLCHASVPLFIRDAHGRFSTSFECKLIPRDLYYALSIELPEGHDQSDDEADMVASYVMAGCDGIELHVDLIEKVMRWSEDYGVYLDIVEFIPRSIILTFAAPAVGYWCWVEQDGQVNYDLPEECKCLLFAFYEYDHQAPPQIDGDDENAEYPEDYDEDDCEHVEAEELANETHDHAGDELEHEE